MRDLTRSDPTSQPSGEARPDSRVLEHDLRTALAKLLGAEAAGGDAGRLAQHMSPGASRAVTCSGVPAIPTRSWSFAGLNVGKKEYRPSPAAASGVASGSACAAGTEDSSLSDEKSKQFGFNRRVGTRTPRHVSRSRTARTASRGR